MRCANLSRVKITQAKTVHGVRFKADMSPRKQIRRPAKRSMNIHERMRFVATHCVCARGPRDSAIFILGWGWGKWRLEGERRVHGVAGQK